VSGPQRGITYACKEAFVYFVLYVGAYAPRRYFDEMDYGTIRKSPSKSIYILIVNSPLKFANRIERSEFARSVEMDSRLLI
jgi:hypothetical protein